MNDEFLQFFCCPDCHGQLVWNIEEADCNPCGRSYPIYDGIPDFRLSVAPAQKSAEWARARALFQGAHPREFHALLRDSILRETSRPEIIKVELEYELMWQKRGKKSLSRLRYLLGKSEAPEPESLLASGLSLDIGCGKGVLMGTFAPFAERMIGIDFSVEYVCFSRALLRELGCANWALAVAEAEHLPFGDRAMRFVSLLDVVEHMADQAAGVSEAFRVLAPTGYAFMNSPNRFSVMAPESHCGLWFVGFLPYRWQSRYVRWKANQSYRGIRLLSYWALSRMLERHTKSLWKATVLVDKGSEAEGRAERLLTRFATLRWILNVAPLKYFAPSHHYLAKK